MDEDSDFCQTQSADFLQRMDVLFLWDLIGTPEPDFQKFLVKKAFHKVWTVWKMAFLLKAPSFEAREVHRY